MKRRDWIFPAVTGGVFLTDQILKHRACRKIPERGTKIPQGRAGEHFAFHNSKNRGAAMNFLQERPKFVLGFSVGYTAAVTLFFILTLGFGGSGLLKTGLSLLLGGAYSNTYDRLKKKQVTDYVSFRKGPKALQKIVFNIADFAIGIGALFTVISLADDKEE